MAPPLVPVVSFRGRLDGSWRVSLLLAGETAHTRPPAVVHGDSDVGEAVRLTSRVAGLEVAAVSPAIPAARSTSVLAPIARQRGPSPLVMGLTLRSVVSKAARC